MAQKKLSVKEAFTKAELVSHLSETHGLTKKLSNDILDSIKEIVCAHLTQQGPGHFSWSGFFKAERIKVNARKERNGVNPFTGEAMVIDAKPACQKIKIKALADLKNLVESK